MRTPLLPVLSLALAAVLPATLGAQSTADSVRSLGGTTPCGACAEWNVPHKPVRIHGSTYYVGTNGLSALLLTSSAGHVLVDAGLPESAPLILANIRSLGFKVEDIRLILNSHAHYDHAGGIAGVQRASGAAVAASAWSAAVLKVGTSGADDPQYGSLFPYPTVAKVRVFGDGDTLRVGPNALVAHLTPGHTPGGTTWSWRSCEAGRCVNVVYADSQTPVSTDGFLFTKSTTYRNAIADFARGHALLDRLRCDVLITPHPAASKLWERVAARDSGAVRALEDPEACRRYAAGARASLARRVELESKTP